MTRDEQIAAAAKRAKEYKTEMPEEIWANEHQGWSYTGAKKHPEQNLVKYIREDVVDEYQWRDIESHPAGEWVLITDEQRTMQACWNSNGWWEIQPTGCRCPLHRKKQKCKECTEENKKDS